MEGQLMPSPVRRQVGRHQAAPCPDPSPWQPATEVDTAQHGQPWHGLELNEGLLQHPQTAAALHGFSTILLNPTRILKPALPITQVPSWGQAGLRWWQQGHSYPTARGATRPVREHCQVSGWRVRQQLLRRSLMTCEIALIQHNICPGVPHWNGKYQLTPRSPTLEF